MKRPNRWLLPLLISASFSTNLYAGEAHEHGIAHLDIAKEAESLSLMLVSPALNFAGFEHAPKNAEQHKKLEEVERQLKQGYSLFEVADDALCILKKVKLEDTPQKEDQKDNHDHDHDHDHKHEHEHEHEHEHNSHDEGHSDYRISYEFKCADPAKLENLTVNLFKIFPATEEIRYQFVSETFQKGGSLKPSQTVIPLK